LKEQTTHTKSVTVIGGGLAGCEAAWQLLRRGIPVVLHEMKPLRFSPAHSSPLLAELVCSNSLRSAEIRTAVGLLKEEMRLLGSLIVEAALATAVPAGKALAVDRHLFSHYIEDRLSRFASFSIERREVTEISTNQPVIIATGPLTSEALAEHISALTGAEHLFFYDAISPIVDAETIDYSRVFRASRYAQDGEGDYLNCPMNREEYERFYGELLQGREVALKDFEDKKCFEGCLPIEVIARRGIDTLRYGPMKPVGLKDPRTGEQPYAVVQLRHENTRGSLYNMVGFQTKLTWPEQKRIFRLIPGLEEAEFERYGSIHRNTFINSPALLTRGLQLSGKKTIFFAGQVTGVEGYVESAATGLLAGIFVHRMLINEPVNPPPETTGLGALINHVTKSESRLFQPMNVNFGLFPPLGRKVPRRERGTCYAERSIRDLELWISETGSAVP